MMDIQLNFLQFQPQKNWLDYFINRQEIYELLNTHKDGTTIINLCDQFIEQALSADRELAHLGINTHQMHNVNVEEDLICMRHKSDDLWMCALSCFAAFNWDINSLNRNSNVIRIHAMLNRLTRWFFEGEDEQSFSDDPFNFICATGRTSKLNRSNTFIAWLYARWIFSIDLESRFPTIPAKPTVSNPYQYVDQNLIQAEKLAQATIEIQRKMPEALQLMKQLIENEENIGNKGIDIPVKECFYPKLDIIAKGSPISVLSNFPKPKMEAGKWTMSWAIFKLKTMFDLMAAHFSARHFSQAKIFLEKIQENWNRIEQDVDSNIVDSLFLPKKEEIEGYTTALGVPSIIKSKSGIWRGEGDPLMDFVKHRPKQQQIPINNFVKMLANGFCRIPKFYRESELRIEGLQLDLIQSFNDELSALGIGHSLLAATQRARLLGSLYFLCSHCNKFANTLANSGQLIDGFKIRNFANISTVNIPQIPTDEQFQEFSTTDNALWNILTSFDINVLRNSFARLDSQIYIDTKRMIFSPISADPILSALSASGDRFFARNQVMLWKLEQLARMGNKEKWMAFLNKFSEDCKAISENSDLLLFDTVRIQLANWNMNYYRSNDPNEFTKYTSELKTVLNATLSRAMQENKNIFQAFSKDLACFLLNNRDWRFVNERIKGHDLFTSPFTNMAVLFSFFFNKLYIENKRGEAFKTAQDVIWKVLSPTFDAPSKTGQDTRKCMFSKDQLLDLLEGIKDIDVMSMLIGLVSFLYNYALSSDQKPLNVSMSASFDANISTLSAVAAAMDTSIAPPLITEDVVVQQHNAGVQLLRNVGRNIYLDNAELWKPIKMDDYKSCDIDIPYIERVLDLLCRQAELVAPVYVPWLRFRADYAFVREKYQNATKLYLETVMALDRGLLGKPGVVEEDNDWAKRLIKRMQADMDSIFGKLAVSLYFLRMPTLAAIVGQMRSDIRPHLGLVDLLLRNTPSTVDAGPAYFPLIADIHLMERMAAAYEHPSLDLPLYRQALLKSMPGRAININNSIDILERENTRRKERFMEILYKQEFGENLGRN